jgi:hypothetical protein
MEATNRYNQHWFLGLIPLAALILVIVGSVRYLDARIVLVDWLTVCTVTLALMYFGCYRSVTDTVQAPYTVRKNPKIGRNVLRTLLEEYDACHVNRNHYDQTRWIIGSIFIVSSFTLVSASFLAPAVNYRVSTGLIGAASLILWLVFLYYDNHVQPWIRASLDRCFDIERRLQNIGFDIRLHSSIRYELEQKGEPGSLWKHEREGSRSILDGRYSDPSTVHILGRKNHCHIGLGI